MAIRKEMRRCDLKIDAFQLYQLRGIVIRQDPWRLNLGPAGSYDAYALVTGNFFEGYLKYCREDDEDSQRQLWNLLREDILTAADKLQAPTPWGCRFD